jgi:hypothetical protein
MVYSGPNPELVHPQCLFRREFIFNTRRWSATLADDGLQISSDAAKVFYYWPFIKRVFREKRYVIVEITPIRQVHIPIRAFSDEEHILKFLEIAQSYVKRPAV